MPNLTRDVFDRTASTYDQDRARLIPGCDTFYRWAVDLIPSRAKHILELGAGSGILTQLVRARHPTATLHLIDFSEPMLALARQRLSIGGHPDPNITFHHADYLAQPLPGEMCAIVSSLSIHHLENAGKRLLFARAHSALKPNGVFVNADHIAGPTPQLELRYQSLWLAQVRAAGATEQQIADSLFRQKEDRRAPVPDQIAWMRDAGFADADCWYKDNCFAVMAGTRP